MNCTPTNQGQNPVCPAPGPYCNGQNQLMFCSFNRLSENLIQDCTASGQSCTNDPDPNCRSTTTPTAVCGQIVGDPTACPSNCSGQVLGGGTQQYCCGSMQNGQCTAPGGNPTNMCCPTGYSADALQCPFGTDTNTTCCKRLDFGQYDTKAKITCGTTTPGMCCPTGYSTDAASCPAFTDLVNNCCKRNGFGNYDVKPKVACTLGDGTPPTYDFCLQAAGDDVGKCHQCYDQKPSKIWTAFGCISEDPQSTVTDILKIGLGMAGGFVLLSILYGSFLLTTSSGEPKRIQEGQEMITSAIMGLLFIIFSIVILQFIGIKLLQIPGFGTAP